MEKPKPTKKTSVIASMRDLFSTGIFSDFVVVVGEKNIRCHSSVLKQNSPVLNRMLETKMLGKT